MLTYLGINYNCEELPVEHIDNVYKNGEFQIKLPPSCGLVSMPKIVWTRVRNMYNNHFCYCI